MNRLPKTFLLLSLGSLLYTACGQDDPTPVNEEELITTLKLTFTPAIGSGAPVTATWKDLDGEGSNPPTVSPITLEKNTAYNVTLELLNENANPASDITREISSEDEEHQFFFQPSPGLGLSYQYNDRDSNNQPVGLSTIMATANANSTGTLTVTLRHLPNKAASGVAAGNIANAGGETDIQTAPPFPVTIN